MLDTMPWGILELGLHFTNSFSTSLQLVLCTPAVPIQEKVSLSLDHAKESLEKSRR